MFGFEKTSLMTIVTWFGVMHLGPAVQVTGNTQVKMLNELLANYDVNDWPNANKSQATDVHIQMFINSFGSLNAANMDYSIDVFLRQRWHDSRLQLTGDRDQITVTDQKMQGMIWKPDTFFNNVKDAEIHRVTMNNILLRLNKTGHVLYSMRITLKLSCNLQLEDFPFDEQECEVALASYANTDDVIKYHWVENKAIDLPDQLEIAQFDLLGYKTKQVTQSFVTGDFSGLEVHFTLRRQNGYHVLQTYVPTILIVSISWVSFWLDPNAVPGRVSLGVTTLLTLTTLASGIRQSLPPVSYVKAIDVWVGMCMIMVFGALLEFTFVNWIANKKIINPARSFKIPKFFAGSDAEQVGNLVGKEEVDEDEGNDEDEEEEEKAEKARMKDAEIGKQFACQEGPGAKPATYIMHARAVDRLCRIVFPGGFLLFNLIYWPYYMLQQYSDPGPLILD